MKIICDTSFGGGLCPVWHSELDKKKTSFTFNQPKFQIFEKPKKQKPNNKSTPNDCAPPRFLDIKTNYKNHGNNNHVAIKLTVHDEQTIKLYLILDISSAGDRSRDNFE